MPSFDLAPTRAESTEIEARAKIIWGDPPATVLAYLLANNHGEKSARDLLARLLRERKASIRASARTKVLRGLLCLLGALLGGTLGILYAGAYDRLLGVFAFLGLYGLWKIVSGLWDFFYPASQSGDLSHILE